jgi:CheY-like chemotaxis protein
MPKGGTLAIHAVNTQIDAQYAASRGDARAGPHVLITVTDEGTGMPKELLSKIFDPFFTTKEAGKGTGLGLSTTLSIIKSHSGFIEIDSEQDHGTCFRVYLPADPSAFTEEPAEPVEHLPRGQNQMVLVVDDEAPVREITCQSLQTFGYRVMSASNGAEASVLYARHQNEIDAVLTDMMMPVMDGASTIQVIRKFRPDARIIAASGVNTEMDATRAKNCGADVFLPKPYNTSGLLTALEQLLQPRTV